ncbi:MAG: CRISPR-associated endonuclease Cas2 [Tepidibacter sp.]|jgi:CRISPR-associated protein Cas2|uniref:CRISPR-associated endonuclease Cas2 n=1 Tax=Tepidibacter sp. TaxID=2529387 RepID=UPI0025DEA716|nr:CRISPR-associated endonuclease Cas2 [Tepidibacter sp.]MCT4509906.1 CRISPR-associated endonuclease Cas2 [Tepidibacter sp.]
MIYLISYDIVNDKKRTKLFKLLKNYGVRHQYSVFECELDEKKYVELIYKIRKIKVETGDSIMVYPICATCESKIVRCGSYEPIEVRNMIF